MTTPEEEPNKEPGHGPSYGNYGEIAPGVPRYGEYAPPGSQPPPYTAPTGSLPVRQAGRQGRKGTVGQLIQRRTALAPPRTVEIAFRMIIAAGVIEAVLAVLAAATLFTPAGQSTALQVMRDMGLDDQSLLEPLLIASLLLSMLAVVIYVVIAFQIRKGRNWARITGAILAVLSLLALVQPNYITAVQLALGIIAEIILFRAPAKDYFKR
ncbi:hypothetical protein IV498_00875 [Paenarthrobacter sp. Z7-10]|uniref:hypothetical protein n=1 Tax=Paenarthrobacter sp. Z7-10 TaxID=2787635 RepID=UPI0022A96FCE|nr:hypothetical protein [Paenarthrobacter sp. Z7-10]MCZ2401772.1 hypothetical protein [Paenarthrobacter sp. Z7-10]